MTNINRLIIFLTFILLGCAPNIIEENKVIQKIENDALTSKEKEVQSFEEWAEEESKKDTGYSEEHIKQMTDPKHNQWGVAGEPKKGGVH